MNIRLIVVTTALTGLCTIALAQQPSACTSRHCQHNQPAAAAQPASPHAGHGATTGDNSPSSAAFRAINARMHAEINAPLTGDADADFVRNMIPHHQGAIDMAKIILAFGKDPELRKLAENVIAAQDSEISLMKAWLARNAK